MREQVRTTTVSGLTFASWAGKGEGDRRRETAQSGPTTGAQHRTLHFVIINDSAEPALSWRQDGVVEAHWGAVALRGWAGSHQRLLDVLAGWQAPDEVLARAAELPEQRAERTTAAIGASQLYDPDCTLLFERSHREQEMLLDRLADVRARVRPAEVIDFLAEQAARLRADSPQVEEVTEAFVDLKGDAASGRAFTWLDPRQVLKTGFDTTWGQFGNRAGMPADVVTKLLTSTDPAQWLRRFLDPGNSIKLLRYTGTQGPVYEINQDGVHRTHVARMLELPLVLAELSHYPLSRTLAPHRGVPGWGDEEAATVASRALAQLWPGVLARGLAAGSVSERDGRPVLHLEGTLPAPWLVSPARTAVSTMAAYERVHPGTTRQLGIPGRALANAATWTTWVRGAAQGTSTAPSARREVPRVARQEHRPMQP